MSEVYAEQIKSKNWARRHKRQKGLLNPWKWGYASRARRGGGTGKTVKAEDIRKRLEASNG